MFLRHSFRATTLALCLTAGAVGATTTDVTQSPINISTADAVYDPSLPALVFNYASSVSLTVVDTGSPDEEATVRADVPTGSSLKIGGTTYELLQFHLHAEAEHEIDGKRGDMELHFVHRSADNKFAVVGQIIEIGAENTALAPYFNALASAKGGMTTVTDFLLSQLMPSDTRSYRYSGSLTAPSALDPEEPFDVPVEWNVLATPITVSQGQFDAFKALFPRGDAREVQENDPAPDIVTDVAAIPLPASGVLFLFALGGLAALRRRAA